MNERIKTTISTNNNDSHSLESFYRKKLVRKKSTSGKGWRTNTKAGNMIGMDCSCTWIRMSSRSCGFPKPTEAISENKLEELLPDLLILLDLLLIRPRLHPHRPIRSEKMKA